MIDSADTLAHIHTYIPFAVLCHEFHIELVESGECYLLSYSFP